MSRSHSHLRSAADIIRLYNGAIPFASWLKIYFKQRKKFGSTDRRQIADLCFCYYRLGNAFVDESIEEQLLMGQLLCRDKSDFLNEPKPEWSKVSSLSLKEKIAFLHRSQPPSFFPFLEEVSDAIDTETFNLSHLVQPDLFLRIRPGRREDVLQKLSLSEIDFSLGGDCLRLPITTKIDEVLLLDEEAVVQDKISQQVLEPLSAHWQKATFSAWDCCAASGGKSILLHDLFPGAQLTVSDVRESILHNLRNRFGRAGIRRYHDTA